MCTVMACCERQRERGGRFGLLEGGGEGFLVSESAGYNF